MPVESFGIGFGVELLYEDFGSEAETTGVGFLVSV